MVYEVSNNYTRRKIKDFGRDWTIFVKGISEVEIQVTVYQRVEIN